MSPRFIQALFILFLSLGVFTCANIGDVDPTQRVTFLKLFEKGGNFTGQVAEPVEDGYIMGANLAVGQNTEAFIAKLDFHGNAVWQMSIPSSSVSSLHALSDGYLVFGDGIQTNDTALNINDRVITKALLTKIDLNGNVTNSASFSDPVDTLMDFHGTGISVDASGNILTTGNKKASSSNALTAAYLAVYDPSTFDTLWTRSYSLIDQDFVNAKNVFTLQSGSIVWTNSVEKTNLSQKLSYLTTSSVSPQSTFTNYSFLGQVITQNRLSANEMQPSLFGYGVVGTFSDGQGNNGNLFYVQVDGNGKFLEGTLRFFDGITGAVAADASSLNGTPASQSEDAGLAIAATSDGGFLLGGTLVSTIDRGKGGKDVWLLRIDAAGEIVWNKTFGGAGDDAVSSIRVLPDNSFLISGSSATNGLSAAYLMRIGSLGVLQE